MREWLYNKLITLTGFEDLVFENTSLDTVPDTKPFIVYSIGNRVTEIEDGDAPIAQNSVANIWVHDNRGTYTAIDATLKDIRALLSNLSEVGIIAARFINESDDLRDPEMNTICRFARYQLVHLAEEA